MRQIICPEASVPNYRSTLHTVQEEPRRISHRIQRKIVPLHGIHVYMHTIAPLIPNLDSSRRWVVSLKPLPLLRQCKNLLHLLNRRRVVSLTPRPLCACAKTSCVYWIGSWGNPRAGPDSLQKSKIICSCQDSNSVPPACSLDTIMTELQYSTVVADIKFNGPHVTFQKFRLLHECKSGLQNTDGTIINGSEN